MEHGAAQGFNRTAPLGRKVRVTFPGYISKTIQHVQAILEYLQNCLPSYKG